MFTDWVLPGIEKPSRTLAYVGLICQQSEEMLPSLLYPEWRSLGEASNPSFLTLATAAAAVPHPLLHRVLDRVVRGQGSGWAVFTDAGATRSPCR